MTPEGLRELCHYNINTGQFTWRADGHLRRSGGLVGTVMKSGYRKVMLFGKNYLVHRLAWLYVTGRWPSDMIDHINGNRDDNRFANLRECDKSQNHANSVRKRVSKTGFQGVSRVRKRYVARFNYRGTTKRLGSFLTAEEAHEAYVTEVRRCHGEFCRVD